MHMMDKIFKDKHGKVVVLEKPNAALITWFISWVLSHVLPYGQLNFVAALVAFGSLFAWAWMEIFDGSCYFRRALGAFVLVAMILARI
jgi:hypothetical protein